MGGLGKARGIQGLHDSIQNLVISNRPLGYILGGGVSAFSPPSARRRAPPRRTPYGWDLLDLSFTSVPRWGRVEPPSGHGGRFSGYLHVSWSKPRFFGFLLVTRGNGFKIGLFASKFPEVGIFFEKNLRAFSQKMSKIFSPRKHEKSLVPRLDENRVLENNESSIFCSKKAPEYPF